MSNMANPTYTLQNISYWTGAGNLFRSNPLTVENGRFKSSPSTSAQLYNMQKLWAVPGFTDSHVHLVSYALAATRLKLDGMNLSSIQEVIRFAAEKSPESHWIRGRGWEAACREDGGFPHKNEIDQITQSHPVVLFAKDGHTVWLNSMAITELGIPRDVCDPPGGKYERDSSGDFTGVARETAVDAIRDMLPPVDKNTKKKMIVKASENLLKQGIVAVHSFEGLEELELLMEMEEDGQLPIRVICSFNLPDLQKAIRLGLKPGYGCGKVRLSGLKLYADGALGSRSAAVLQPYTDEPENYGMEVMTLQEMKDMANLAADHKFPTAIHAIGDKAVQYALTALIEARHRNRDLKGLRVEHVQLVQPEDLEKFKHHKITASIQPCHMLSDIEMAEKYWSNQTAHFYPYGTLEKLGTHLLLGSDAPIDDENPLKNIRGAVTRRRIEGPWSNKSWIEEEKMTLAGAFKAYCSNPSLIEPGEERGRIAPGLPADFVLLSRNPFAENAVDLHELEIKGVFLNGCSMTTSLTDLAE